jgi:hypothetical protein
MIRRALISGVVAALVGCSAVATLPQQSLAHLTASSTSPSWNDEVMALTRRHESYDWMMRTADLRATLVTPRLRQAFIASRDQYFGRFADEQAQELLSLGRPSEAVDAATTSGPKGEEDVLVFVAMYAADQKNRDLSASYSIWDVVLARDGVRVKPSSVENVRSSPAVLSLFPYVDRFDDLYLFRFPLVDSKSGTTLMQPGQLTLHADSALANVAVGWELAP